MNKTDLLNYITQYISVNDLNEERKSILVYDAIDNDKKEKLEYLKSLGLTIDDLTPYHKSNLIYYAIYNAINNNKEKLEYLISLGLTIDDLIPYHKSWFTKEKLEWVYKIQEEYLNGKS